MFVIQLPIKTSSILFNSTSDNFFISSGSFGQATNGSVIEFKSIFKEAGAKHVEAMPLQSIAVQGDMGSYEVVKYFVKTFR